MMDIYVGWYNDSRGYVSFGNSYGTLNLHEATIFVDKNIPTDGFELVSLYEILTNAATIAEGNPFDGICLQGIFHRDDAIGLETYGTVVRVASM